MAMTSTSKMASIADETFLTWFCSQGGSIDSAVGLTTFPGMGRGAVALQDIKKGAVLFVLPRSLTLSTRTSCLPFKFGYQAWKMHELHRGWVGLILCMLWEAAAGTDGKWSGYLNSLPDSFQTPMFWSEVDLEELEGTTISDKIGKSEAEKNYYETLLPAVWSRPDLFPPSSVERHYSLHKYHIMGSLILSRSFHVEKLNGMIGENGKCEPSPASAANGSDIMDVDATRAGSDNCASREGEDADDEADDTDDEEYENTADVAMVPMADMLNARYKSENATLHYGPEDLQMISTRDIAAGEQIWNTYGDPPNSYLLRQYGHVDLISTSEKSDSLNPADVVEIRADLVVDILRQEVIKTVEDPFFERIEWWLEEGGDDLFTLETNLLIPDSLMSLVILLTMPESEWEYTRDKGKMPQIRLNSRTLQLVSSVLNQRLRLYKTSIEEDKAILSSSGNEIGNNKRMATVVRLGEKRILKGALAIVMDQLARLGYQKNDKRQGSDDVDGSIHRKKQKN